MLFRSIHRKGAGDDFKCHVCLSDAPDRAKGSAGGEHRADHGGASLVQENFQQGLMSEKRKAADGGIKTLYSIISTVPSDRHCVTGLSDGRVLSSAPIRYDLMSQTEI